MCAKKIISYALWGNDPRYTFTAIKNCKLAAHYFPEYICRFYLGMIPYGIKEELEKFSNVEIITMPRDEGWNGMFWRFYAASDPNVDIVLCRDVDSELCYREKVAVDEWTASDKDFHIMRDQYYHGTHICGGMWGCRNKILLNMKELIDNYTRKESNNRKNIDQEFLADIIYPRVIAQSFVHDTFARPFNDRTKDFPIPRKPPFRELTLNVNDDDDYIGRVSVPDKNSFVEAKYFDL